MVSVSVRELKARLTHYLRRLEAGEAFMVTRRGKAVALLIKASGEQAGARTALLRLAAEGAVAWGGAKPQGLVPPVALDEGPTIAEQVAQDRR